MKAIVAYRYGTPDVLQVVEMKRPTPKENELLVRIHASTISSADCSMRRGDPFFARFFTGLTRPKYAIPGDVLAGEIVEVGRNVTRFRVGEHIYGVAGIEFGAHAEYKCMPETSSITQMPENLSFVEAAAVVDGALTALPFLRDTGFIKSGQQILINGASGAVGVMGVQLALYYGAHVTGVCSNANFSMVQALGATHMIDYNKTDFTKSEQQFDIIFDAAGKSTFTDCKQVLKPNGIYLSTVPSLPLILQMMTTANSKNKKAVFVATGLRKSEEKSKDLRFLKTLLEEGKIKPVIDQSYRMEYVSNAHAYVEKGHKKGAVVILIG